MNIRHEQFLRRYKQAQICEKIFKFNHSERSSNQNYFEGHVGGSVG